MDPNYLRGVWFPILVNFLTKASSKAIEQESNLQTDNVSHAAILFVVSNVAIKAMSMSAMLPRDRSLYLKIGCFFAIIGYDFLSSLLFTQNALTNFFDSPSQETQHKSWLSLGLLDATYIAFIAYRHHQERRESAVTNQLALLEAGSTDHVENNVNQPISRLTWTVNQLQMPLKFTTGVLAFFYGIQLGEKSDWPLQLPLSSAFYGSAMALTQIACNLLKQEKNWSLVLYALACGTAEGIAYFSTLRFLPDEISLLLKSLIVSIATSTCIFLAGNLLFLAFEKIEKTHGATTDPGAQLPDPDEEAPIAEPTTGYGLV